MPAPNMMIIGAQKCGTTWLHRALSRSQHFFGSDVKELNYFNKKKLGDYDEYCDNFADPTGEAKFLYESTPHYFRLPKNDVDTAERIKNSLGDIPLLLMLREPTSRYLSAYTHHMMQDRIPNKEVLDDIVDEYGVLELGFYAEILTHFQKHFSQIHIRLYDDLKNSPEHLVQSLMDDFDLENDIDAEQLDFRTNAKDVKAKKKNLETLPRLSNTLKERLHSMYKSDTEKLQGMIDRDLSAWMV